MRQSHRHLALLGALAIGLAMALVGCTAPTHSGPTSARPSTPAATPSQPAVPQSTLPLDCGALADGSKVTAHYQGDTVKAVVDQSTPARGFTFRAFQQAGGLHCVWGGSGRTDGGYDLGMEVYVLTDAASQYAAYAAGLTGDEWVGDHYGTHSKSTCYVSEGFVQCSGDVLIGRTWLDYRLTDDKNAAAAKQPSSWVDEQILPVVAAISHAGTPRPAWSPGSAYDASSLCDAPTASAIAGAPVTVTKPAGDSGSPTEIGMTRAAAALCDWTSASAEANVSISALTGGAWALSGFAADPAETPGPLLGPAVPATIAGTDGAFTGDGESAWGAVVTHGSLIEVLRESSSSGTANIPLMTRIAAYVDAHG